MQKPRTSPTLDPTTNQSRPRPSRADLSTTGAHRPHISHPSHRPYRTHRRILGPIRTALGYRRRTQKSETTPKQPQMIPSTLASPRDTHSHLSISPKPVQKTPPCTILDLTTGKRAGEPAPDRGHDISLSRGKTIYIRSNVLKRAQMHRSTSATVQCQS